MLRKHQFVNGEYYHIYNRGIDKRVIFKSRKDYERFMMLLYIGNSNDSFRLDGFSNKDNQKLNTILKLERSDPLVSIGAWCLMPNHFHLLVRQESKNGITKFMKKTGTGYSMFFNIKYERTGSLFGGLFKSKLVGVDDDYMRQLFGYIHINPLDIKFNDWKDGIKNSPIDMRQFLESYQYSSYLDYIGKDRPEGGIINPEKFPAYFENNKSFKDFVGYYIDQESF